MDYIKDINAPYLSADEQTICEGRLTLKEIYEALSYLSSNKTPGNDGLSREFYLAFFDLLGNEVLASLNYSYQIGELSNSQRHAVVTLVEKRERQEIHQKLDTNLTFKR